MKDYNHNEISIDQGMVDDNYNSTINNVFDISKIKSYSYWIDKKNKAAEELKNSKLLPFGLRRLDEKMKLYGKRLLFIVARSGYGKTSFASMMMREQLRENRIVLAFSCEEAGEDFITRISTLYGGLTEEQKSNFYLVDNPKITMNELTKMCIGLKLKVGLDCVYIDQLNKLYPDKPYKSKHERIVMISEELQALVKIIECPVVVLHQANRSSEGSAELMSQASVSDADAVYNESQIMMFIESPEYYQWSREKKDDKTLFEYIINVDKNRIFNGWTGRAHCYFDRATGIFINKSDIHDYRDLQRSIDTMDIKEKEPIETIYTKSIDEAEEIDEQGLSVKPPF